jgi:cytochrome c-type biogenesis protein CcmH/NrfG
MMAPVAALDPEFGQAVLAQRIVMGAAQEDRARLHGAILAALELHPPHVAVASILAPALREAGRAHAGAGG